MRTYALLCALAAMSGCYRVALVDDVDLELNWIPLLGPSDALHSPYVQGASMGIFVENSDGRESMINWTIASSNPAVFTVDSIRHDSNDRRLYASGRALTPGNAVLEVHDGNDHIVHTEPVRVELPDRVELLPHGPLMLQRSDLPATFGDGHILAGGTSTYLTRYYKNNELLTGNGALSVETGGNNASGAVLHSFLFEDRDWLQITPALAGAYTLNISVGGTAVTPVSGTALARSELADLRIYGQNESQARKDDWLLALGVGLDSGTLPVYGVEFTWFVDGVAAGGEGDLYRYKYLPGTTGMKELRATYNGMDSMAVIHSGGGFVDSTNHVGCAVGGHGRMADPLAAMVVLSLAVLVIRRRRGSQERPTR